MSIHNLIIYVQNNRCNGDYVNKANDTKPCPDGKVCSCTQDNLCGECLNGTKQNIDETSIYKDNQLAVICYYRECENGKFKQDACNISDADYYDCLIGLTPCANDKTTLYYKLLTEIAKREPNKHASCKKNYLCPKDDINCEKKSCGECMNNDPELFCTDTKLLIYCDNGRVQYQKVTDDYIAENNITAIQIECDQE